MGLKKIERKKPYIYAIVFFYISELSESELLPPTIRICSNRYIFLYQRGQDVLLFINVFNSTKTFYLSKTRNYLYGIEYTFFSTFLLNYIFLYIIAISNHRENKNKKCWPSCQPFQSGSLSANKNKYYVEQSLSTIQLQLISQVKEAQEKYINFIKWHFFFMRRIQKIHTNYQYFDLNFLYFIQII